MVFIVLITLLLSMMYLIGFFPFTKTNISYRIMTDKQEYQYGDTINIDLIIRNEG